MHEASTLDLANQLMPNLKRSTNSSRYNTSQHFSTVDAINESDAEALAKKQEVLDKHDDEIAEISVSLNLYGIATQLLILAQGTLLSTQRPGSQIENG